MMWVLVECASLRQSKAMEITCFRRLISRLQGKLFLGVVGVDLVLQRMQENRPGALEDGSEVCWERGYVERKNFLERVDQRQFELEKSGGGGCTLASIDNAMDGICQGAPLPSACNVLGQDASCTKGTVTKGLGVLTAEEQALVLAGMVDRRGLCFPRDFVSRIIDTLSKCECKLAVKLTAQCQQSAAGRRVFVELRTRRVESSDTKEEDWSTGLCETSTYEVDCAGLWWVGKYS
ncbi:hypothetical protein MHYP_G00126930 [Metynnis hypsauchen]